MTLNNLAGGVAGGVAGISPLIAGIGALVASYLMMSAGHYVGRRLGSAVEQCVDPRVVAAVIFVSVAIAQLVDAAQTWRH